MHIVKRKKVNAKLTLLVNVSSAAKAASNTGNAFPKSRSQSSLIAWAALACSFAISSSAFTIYVI